jgi:hypothetical protein
MFWETHLRNALSPENPTAYCVNGQILTQLHKERRDAPYNAPIPKMPQCGGGN